MFTDTEKAQIRLYLGRPDQFRYVDTRLESMLTTVSAEAEVIVRAALAKLVTIEAAMTSDDAIENAGLKRVDEIWFENGWRRLAEIRKLGRMQVGRISITLGVPIYSDVFGSAGYLGDSFSDIRTNRVTVRTRTWSGDRPDDGTPTDEDLELNAYYPVRYISSQEISSSAGAYEIGDVLVDHITPSDGGSVGYTLDQLKPEVLTNNVEIIYILTGEHPGEYTLIECRTFRPFTWQLVLRRRASTP
jgi:hypothetical protein